MMWQRRAGQDRKKRKDMEGEDNSNLQINFKYVLFGVRGS